MKKLLLSSAALVAMTGAAFAADETALSMAGITLYGTLDMGVSYQTHGVPNSDYFPAIESLVSKNQNKSIFQVAPNGLSSSKIGVKGEELLVDGWTGLFNLQTQFVPTSGQIVDGPKSLVQNNGVALANQTANGDSSRAGQPFTNAYAGVSNKTFGTLTFGRQNSLLLDEIIKYDPQGGSQNFSVIGYSGVAGGGGVTQDARLDNSVEYKVTIGPVRAIGQYKFGSYANEGSTFAGGLGTDLGHLSVDALFTHNKDAVSVSNIGLTTASIGLQTLAGTISDNTAYSIMASYDFGAPKVSAGYEFIRYANPSDPIPSTAQDVGGYMFGSLNQAAYNNKKELQISWVGLKYALSPKFDVTGAYYHYDQNAYYSGTNRAAWGCRSEYASSCAGQLNAISLVADYKFTKRFDAYAGVMWSGVSDGLASGYLHTATIDPAIGFRFNF